MMPSSIFEIFVPIVIAAVASSGFWAFLDRRSCKRNKFERLLIGLAHDRIVHVGRSYLHRGWITYDEYEDFIKYLYDPYSEFGGNGLAERIKDEVEGLPIKSVPIHVLRGRSQNDDKQS